MQLYCNILLKGSTMWVAYLILAGSNTSSSLCTYHPCCYIIWFSVSCMIYIITYVWSPKSHKENSIIKTKLTIKWFFIQMYDKVLWLETLRWIIVFRSLKTCLVKWSPSDYEFVLICYIFLCKNILFELLYTRT